MLKFSDVYGYLRDGLLDADYEVAGPKPMPTIHPGPYNERTAKTSPQSMVFATVGNGLGLATEALYDRVMVTLRVLGLQNNYDSAEGLAHDLDRILLDAVNGTQIGSVRTLYVHRAGGAPNLVLLDDAERYHFQATYVTEVKR